MTQALRIDPEVEQREIDLLVAELMKPGAKFYPFSQEHLVEAISEMSGKDFIELRDALIESNCLMTGFVVGNAVIGYWTKWARMKAESQVLRSRP